MHRTGKVCEACASPLKTPDSAVLMDRDGRSYHVTCWVKREVTETPTRRQPRVARRKTPGRRTPPASS
jgi:hypothetical protein